MGAGMARAYGLQTMRSHGARHIFVRQQGLQMPFHLAAIARDQVVAAGLEEMLAILPGRRDHRNAACQRFEHSNRRDPGQRAGVWPPRDMHRGPVSREDFRHAVVGQPAGVFNSRACQHIQRAGRIPDPVDARAQAQRFHRLDQEFAELFGALAITPVADPDQVARRLRDRTVAVGERLRAWIKHARVRRFVPRPGIGRPALGAVDVPNRPPEGEHAVVVS